MYALVVYMCTYPFFYMRPLDGDSRRISGITKETEWRMSTISLSHGGNLLSGKRLRSNYLGSSGQACPYNLGLVTENQE
jgi:hypothetical protein